MASSSYSATTAVGSVGPAISSAIARAPPSIPNAPATCELRARIQPGGPQSASPVADARRAVEETKPNCRSSSMPAIIAICSWPWCSRWCTAVRIAAASSIRTHGTPGMPGPERHERHVERPQRKRVLLGERHRQREHGVDAAGERHALEEAVAGRDVAEVVEQHVVARLGERVGGARDGVGEDTTA